MLASWKLKRKTCMDLTSTRYMHTLNPRMTIIWYWWKCIGLYWSRRDDNGGRNRRSNEKVIEVGYFKEWKVGTSPCASIVKDSNLNFFQVEQAWIEPKRIIGIYDHKTQKNLKEIVGFVSSLGKMSKIFTSVGLIEVETICYPNICLCIYPSHILTSIDFYTYRFYKTNWLDLKRCNCEDPKQCNRSNI